MFTKLSTKTNQLHFKDCCQVRPLTWNIPANFKEEIEHAAHLYDFYTTTAHCQAEEEAIFGHQNMPTVHQLPLFTAQFDPL